MAAKGETKARRLPFSFPFWLHSLIKERRDKKESDFQEQT